MRVEAIYKQRILSTAVKNRWTDGTEMAFFENKLHLVGGWNSDESPQLNKEHWTINLDGSSPTLLGNASGNIKHTFLLFVAGGYLWNIGGNGVVDVNRYSSGSGWEALAADWNIDAYGREHFARCYDPSTGYAYIMLGHKYASPSESIPFIYRSTIASNFTIWETVAELPVGMHNANSGCLVPFKGNLIFFGGGDVSVGIPYYINTKVWQSTDGGFTWTSIADSPLLNSGIWGDAVAFDDTIMYLSGSDVNNSLTANNRFLITHNAIDFYQPALKVAGRHATARCADNRGNFYFSMGFGQNDLIKFKRMADKVQCYL